MVVFRLPHFAKTGHQIGVDRFPSQKSVDGKTVVTGKKLQLLYPDPPRALFNRHEGRTRHADDLGRLILTDARILPRQAQAPTDFLRAQFIQIGHGALPSSSSSGSFVLLGRP